MAYNKAKWRDPQLVQQLATAIKQVDLPHPFTIMEVCGTHTMAIAQYGLKALLPPTIKLISGPGCPVCVTPPAELSRAISLAQLPEVILCSYGDLLRVPCAAGSLLAARDHGAAVQLVFSPLEALEIATNQPHKQVIFLAVGFETTAPTTAIAIELAQERNLDNFQILCLHKTMPQALRALLTSAPVEALLCPGHVATITGSEHFRFVAEELGKSAVVAGFEPVDMMVALLMLVRQQAAAECALINAYPRGVTPHGNQHALEAMARVFQPCDSLWRGLGEIAGSGLRLREQWRDFDALTAYPLPLTAEPEPEGCCCGAVLSGRLTPHDCPLFAGRCCPERPVGACMVSSEGACAAAYRYREVSR